MPVTRPPRPGWRSVSTSRRPRCAASSRFQGSTTSFRPSDAKRSPDRKHGGPFTRLSLAVAHRLLPDPSGCKRRVVLQWSWGESNPSPVCGLSDPPGFRRRGLLARLLWALPTSYVGWRDTNPRPADQTVVEAYATRLGALVEHLAEWTDPVVLTFGTAHEAFVAWTGELEPRMRRSGDLVVIPGLRNPPARPPGWRRCCTSPSTTRKRYAARPR
ncbi:MAG TPA: DUF3987 domain-containing protein [Acidimicrobiales bacterium]